MTNEELLAEARRRQALRAQGAATFGPSRLLVVAPEDVARTAEEQKRDDVLEREEQREIIKRFKAIGCDVWPTSSNKRAKIRPGFPDLWVFGPLGSNLAWWWESKRQKGGRLSPTQVDFQRGCADTNTIHGYGDRYDAERFLIARGLAEFIGGALERVRR